MTVEVVMLVCVCTAVCSEGSIEAATVSLYQKSQMILLLLSLLSCTTVHCAYKRYGDYVVKMLLFDYWGHGHD